jgi:hypothetical protein
VTTLLAWDSQVVEKADARDRSRGRIFQDKIWVRDWFREELDETRIGGRAELRSVAANEKWKLRWREHGTQQRRIDPWF